MNQNIPRHKVFVSFHHDDDRYRDIFAKIMEDNLVDKAVRDGDINDSNMKTGTIRQKIRDEFISDATVIVVLVGPCTWQRKHVDWEIGSGLRYTRKNPRCGLLGIRLPNHPDYGTNRYFPYRIPPRLADNCDDEDPFGVASDPFAVIHDWPKREKARRIKKWIHRAFERRNELDPDNSRRQFGRNWSGDCRKGWTD